MITIVLTLVLLFYLVPSAYAQTAETFNKLGDVKYEQGNYKEAIEYYSKAIKINPKYAAAHYNRGLAKIQRGQKGSGCLDLSKAGELGDADALDARKEHCN